MTGTGPAGRRTAPVEPAAGTAPGRRPPRRGAGPTPGRRPPRALGPWLTASALLVAGCGGASDGEAVVTTTTVATTTTLGEPVVLGTATALELVEGQCYLPLPDGGDSAADTTTTAGSGPDAVELEVVQVVDCGSGHEGRVYASFCLVPDDGGQPVAGGCPGDPTAPWPGDRDLRRAAVRGCLARFEPTFGEPYAASERTSLELTPDAEAWAVGHRRVVCAIEP